MRKKKIALFIPSLGGGGAEKVMVNLAKGFLDRGFDIDLVLLKVKGPFLSELPESIRIVSLSSARIRYCLMKLARYIRSEKPDAMVSSMSGPSILAIIARFIARTPFQLVARVESVLSVQRKKKGSIGGAVVFNLLPWIFKFADGIVAVSHGVATDLIRNFNINEERIKVIYNPIVDSSFFLKANGVCQHTCRFSGLKVSRALSSFSGLSHTTFSSSRFLTGRVFHRSGYFRFASSNTCFLAARIALDSPR